VNHIDFRCDGSHSTEKETPEQGMGKGGIELPFGGLTSPVMLVLHPISTGAVSAMSYTNEH
jgi:hypothetical protein